uniref:Crystaline entomocidal protoxin n=1 Tax=Bacillus thuringiensis subsp. finitimus TaxID=29337 RepID=Q306M5_BACTF|nr:crystal protein Cry28Aa [Bacillus thuringiensis serovar finitimus]
MDKHINKIGVQSTEVNSESIFFNPEVDGSDTVAVVSAGIVVVGTILTAFASFVNPGVVLISFGTLAPVLWPDPEEDPKKIWSQFMKHGEDLLNQTISTAVKEIALAHLNGFKDVLTYYERAFNDWKRNPSANTARLVSQRFENAHFNFVSNMPQLQLPTYDTLLLSCYTEAANLHLNLLHQGVQFADQWNADQPHSPMLKSSGTYYDELLVYIEKYINYCTKTYHKGLNHLKESEKITWDAYNTYRREMTLIVLDLVATFPFYDIRRFPRGVELELTREVYTSLDPPGLNAGPIPEIDFSYLEDHLTRPPGLFTWLSDIELYTESVAEGDYLSGIRESKYYTGNQFFTMKNIYGNTNRLSKQLITLLPGEFITHLSINRGFQTIAGINKLYSLIQKIVFTTFKNDNEYQKNFNVNNQNEPQETTNYPNDYGGSNSQKFKHNLSHFPLIIHKLEFAEYFHSIFALGWTHNSVNSQNLISESVSTQIPLVKAYEVTNNSVIRGPGFTGGDLIELRDKCSIKCKASSLKKYAISLFYAANNAIAVSIDVGDSGAGVLLQPTFSRKGNNNFTIQDLNYKDFQYHTLLVDIELPESEEIHIHLKREDDYEEGVILLIDKLEFKPIDENYTNEMNLEKAKKAVNVLFINATNALKMDVTDYHIDQVANLVECISDDLYAKEKIKLLHAIKFAKQLSQARNLLSDPNFNNLNAENSWTANTGVTIIEGDPLYKGRAIQLSAARDENFPTYLYQKIDESLLKPYTRYQLRGFVEGSQDLELDLVRYGATDIVMNVPGDLEILSYSAPINPCEEIETRLDTTCGALDRCKQSNYVNSAADVRPDQVNGDPHAFSFHIDTGTTDNNRNLGIWIIFKIATPDGYATFGNLELIELGPLSGEALAQVQRKEQKWGKNTTQKREEAAKLYAAAKQTINQLFADSQGTKLRFDTEFSNILSADKLVYKIRDVYSEVLSVIPGLNYDLFMELENRIQNAIDLYDARNTVTNGEFRNGLANWMASSNTEVRQIQDTSVLVLSSWNAQVAQSLNVKPDHGYVLRVTAKKEGIGNGYVTILDCANHIDTLTFSSCDSGFTTSSNELAAYVTKTLEIFPDTDQIRIEIGETEGTFYVESVDLIRMED